MHGNVRKVGDRGAAILKIQNCLNFPEILIGGCLGDASSVGRDNGNPEVVVLCVVCNPINHDHILIPAVAAGARNQHQVTLHALEFIHSVHAQLV